MARVALVCCGEVEEFFFHPFRFLAPSFPVEILTTRSADRNLLIQFGKPKKNDTSAGLPTRILHSNREGGFRRGDLSRELKDFDIAHIIQFDPEAAQAALEAKKRDNLRIVFSTFDNLSPSRPVETKIRAIQEKFWEKTDSLIAHTRGARRVLLLRGAPESQVHLIPPGIDTDALHNPPPDKVLAETLNISENQLVVAYWGPISWERGIFDLLAAAAVLQRWQSGPSIRILFVGEGPEAETLRKMIPSMGLKTFVQAVEGIESQDVAKFLGLIDLLVFPGIPTRDWNAPLPLRMVAGMAAGVPAIASTAGEIPDFLGQGGVLVPPCHHQELADNILRFAEDSSTLYSYSSAAREEARQRFSASEIAHRIGALYDSILTG